MLNNETQFRDAIGWDALQVELQEIRRAHKHLQTKAIRSRMARSIRMMRGWYPQVLKNVRDRNATIRRQAINSAFGRVVIPFVEGTVQS